MRRRNAAAKRPVDGRGRNPLRRTTDALVYGAVDRLSPLVARVVAENPSKFTYKGTGTYIIGRDEVVVVDPGPNLDSHRGALERALEGRPVRGSS